MIECPVCDGTGYIVCAECDGSGQVDDELEKRTEHYMTIIEGGGKSE